MRPAPTRTLQALLRLRQVGTPCRCAACVKACVVVVVVVSVPGRGQEGAALGSRFGGLSWYSPLVQLAPSSSFAAWRGCCVCRCVARLDHHW